LLPEHVLSRPVLLTDSDEHRRASRDAGRAVERRGRGLVGGDVRPRTPTIKLERVVERRGHGLIGGDVRPRTPMLNGIVPSEDGGTSGSAGT
jgi:hypothetical protein